MHLTKYNIGFVGLLLFHITVLLFLVDTYSISAKEANIYFNGGMFNVLTLITNLSTTLFGQNDYALRVPFILFYAGSAILLSLLTVNYFKRQRDRLISIAIFMLLPGVNSAALLINESIIVIFGTLLYLYFYRIKNKNCYALLGLFLFIDNSFAILFLALFFYSLSKKDNMLLVISLSLFGFSMTAYGFSFNGSPRGYFLDTFAIYATIFSPVLFLYFFYSLYRIGFKWERDLFWYISMTALVLSLIFSLRQKVAIEDFAPFVVIAVPLMVKLFIHSMRVRLKEFRTIHYMMLRVSLGVLVLSFFLFVCNKTLYLYLEEPSSHIASEHYIVKELAEELKKRDIHNISTTDRYLALRLRFYGIENSDTILLNTKKLEQNDEMIQVMYRHRILKKFYVQDLNNFKLEINK
ncbi:MAG: hypothetical protein WA945_00890 [Arcobacteraceae bacterium]